jgi:hypothetical protein
MNDEEMLEQEEQSADQIDPNVLNTLVKAGENKEGMISLDKEEQEKIKQEENDEPLFKEIKEEATIKPGKIKEKLGKYTERLLFDIKKNPEKFMLNTPRGRMSIEDAIKQGYDPATKDFTDQTPDQMIDGKLQGLSEGGRSKIKELMRPDRAQVPPEEAVSMGLGEESPLIRGQQPQAQEEEAPQISPEMLAALGGGQ